MTCAAASIATVGCAGNGSARNAGNTRVLNLYDTSGGVNWRDTLSASGSGCSGGYWSKTYDEDVNSLRFGSFVLPHVAGYSGTFWGGFTIGTNGDKFNYILPCEVQPCYEDSTHLASQGWICNQWGVIAGGGIKTVVDDNVTEVAKGIPYLIAYQGTSLKVHLANDTLFKPVGVFICNHPWPYYGNIQGDGFAHPLDSIGDYFVLHIAGLNEYGDTLGIVTDTLAKYNPVDPANPIQPKIWHWVNLSEIEDGVQTLRFALETTDVGEYGANTAFYFCMDKLTVDVASSVAKTTAVRKTVVQKPEKEDVEEFADHLTVGSHVGGEAVLYNAQGQVALKTVLKTGKNKLDAKKLPAGKYIMVHHHRVKHFVKK
jgi:hypothetical protein